MDGSSADGSESAVLPPGDERLGLVWVIRAQAGQGRQLVLVQFLLGQQTADTRPSGGVTGPAH